MDKFWENLKQTFVHYKLDSCCCVAPVRMGLLCIGYFNIVLSLLALMGTADNAFTPPLMKVQADFSDNDFSKSLGIMAYATELAFNMLLLSGIYRKDIVLLRVYIYFLIASIISSILVYSIVFLSIVGMTKVVIICILVFQCYVIVLVRSLIVEIKESRSAERNGDVTLYSVVRMQDEDAVKVDEHQDIDVTVEPSTDDPQKKDEHQENEGLSPEQSHPHPELTKDESELPTKLETIKEHDKYN